MSRCSDPECRWCQAQAPSAREEFPIPARLRVSPDVRDFLNVLYDRIDELEMALDQEMSR